jgi:hypothetical protein
MSQSTETLVLQMLERLGSLDDKWDARWGGVQQQLQNNTVELARLATTVEIHEKRSTTLEAMHHECKRTCRQDVDDATLLAQTTHNQISQAKAILKWSAAVAGGIATAVGVIATVLQLIKH